MNYNQIKKLGYFLRTLARSITAFLLCYFGMSVADKLLPYGQNWSFGIMYIFGVLYCCIHVYILGD